MSPRCACGFTTRRRGKPSEKQADPLSVPHAGGFALETTAEPAEPAVTAAPEPGQDQGCRTGTTRQNYPENPPPNTVWTSEQRPKPVTPENPLAGLETSVLKIWLANSRAPEEGCTGKRRKPAADRKRGPLKAWRRAIRN